MSGPINLVRQIATGRLDESLKYISENPLKLFSVEKSTLTCKRDKDRNNKFLFDVSGVDYPIARISNIRFYGDIPEKITINFRDGSTIHEASKPYGIYGDSLSFIVSSNVINYKDYHLVVKSGPIPEEIYYDVEYLNIIGDNIENVEIPVSVVRETDNVGKFVNIIEKIIIKSPPENVNEILIKTDGHDLKPHYMIDKINNCLIINALSINWSRLSSVRLFINGSEYEGPATHVAKNIALTNRGSYLKYMV